MLLSLSFSQSFSSCLSLSRRIYTLSEALDNAMGSFCLSCARALYLTLSLWYFLPCQRHLTRQRAAFLSLSLSLSLPFSLSLSFREKIYLVNSVGTMQQAISLCLFLAISLGECLSGQRCWTKQRGSPISLSRSLALSLFISLSRSFSHSLSERISTLSAATDHATSCVARARALFLSFSLSLQAGIVSTFVSVVGKGNELL